MCVFVSSDSSGVFCSGNMKEYELLLVREKAEACSSVQFALREKEKKKWRKWGAKDREIALESLPDYTSAPVIRAGI